MALIELRDLHKVYRSGAVTFEALKGISLDIERGDYIAIMGHSGSGKSTLLHLTGGLDRPTAGAVRVQGLALDTLSETALARFRRAHVGFVFQFFHLIENLTVQANVELPALLDGRQSKFAVRERAGALLAQLGIAAQAEKYPWQLSGGQQQRVAIARALINDPAMLLVDEPTGNLDSASTQEVLHILRDCHAEGQTLVMVTHDARAAAEAEQVFFLHDGRIIDAMPGGDAQNIAQRLAALL